MRLSIRFQLLIPLLAILGGVLGLSVWAVVRAADRAARRQIEAQVRTIAHTFSDLRVPLTPNVLDLIKGFSGAEFAVVQEGKQFATLPIKTDELPKTLNNDWQSLQLGPVTSVNGSGYFCTGVRLHGNDRVPGGVVYIFYPESQWQQARSALQFELWLMAVGGLASLLLVVAVAHRLSRRVQELERRTRLITGGDFSPMPLPRWNDELYSLSLSVNDMAARLSQLQSAIATTERLRLLGQVSGGLAHQIRNGITGARLAVQVYARSNQKDAEALEVALRQLTLVEKQLQRFLNLGKTEEPRRMPCSLTQLIDEAVQLLRPQCQHARTELRWQVPATDASIIGDAEQLGHLLLNLIGNAVDAAGPGGQVACQLSVARGPLPTEDGWSAIIEVADTGPGPPPAIVERLFEPFVTGKPEGVGLGLAVARQIAKAHGGTIDWRREAGQTIFRVQLPCEPCRAAH